MTVSDVRKLVTIIFMTMQGNKLVFQSPDELEAVYYEAFSHCDIDVMRALWADGEVICIHPGSGIIAGYDSVIRSWSHIFAQSSHPAFEYEILRREENEGLAVHLVAESLGLNKDRQVIVLATNIYKQFEQGWLMIEHHASLVQSHLQGQTLQ